MKKITLAGVFILSLAIYGNHANAEQIVSGTDGVTTNQNHYNTDYPHTTRTPNVGYVPSTVYGYPPRVDDNSIDGTTRTSAVDDTRRGGARATAADNRARRWDSLGLLGLLGLAGVGAKNRNKNPQSQK